MVYKKLAVIVIVMQPANLIVFFVISSFGVRYLNEINFFYKLGRPVGESPAASVMPKETGDFC